MYSEEILFNWQQEMLDRFAMDSKTGGALFAPYQVQYGYLFNVGLATLCLHRTIIMHEY